MVKIPELRDPTLAELDSIIERDQSPYVSQNIGFGEIGKCSRSIWTKINRKEPEVFSSDTLRIFRNGHVDEAAMAADLLRIPGIELYTHDPERDNKQYKADALQGRFTGRLDGVIVGLKQAPSTPHVWEHKSVNEAKFKKLIKAINDFGEKAALFEWDEVYYAQAQSNMYHFDLDRHYMTISTPGLRQITSLRTELDKKYAEALVSKAKRIIEAKHAPECTCDSWSKFKCEV